MLFTCVLNKPLSLLSYAYRNRLLVSLCLQSVLLQVRLVSLPISSKYIPGYYWVTLPIFQDIIDQTLIYSWIFLSKSKYIPGYSGYYWVILDIFQDITEYIWLYYWTLLDNSKYIPVCYWVILTIFSTPQF